MGYRSYSAIGVIALLITVSATTASAQLRGDVYTSQAHQVSFMRPDGGWELRENPAQENGVAVFSNGGGTVIAMLLHQTLRSRDAISSVGELGKRWPALGERIAAMTNSGESGATVTQSDYKTGDDAITFDITYMSTLPSRGTSLTNWVHGFIVRDKNDQQHIYAIRCAAADGVFSAWESQFDMIMPTLTYTGSKVSPVYTGKPFSYWWYGGGAVIALLLLMFLRRGSGDLEDTGRRRPVRMQDQPNAVTQPMPAHTGSQLSPATLPGSGLATRADGSEVSEEMMNVPDSFYFQQAQGKGQEHPEVAPGGPGTTGAFWTCSCGRVNPGEDTFCARCNADRPENT